VDVAKGRKRASRGKTGSLQERVIGIAKKWQRAPEIATLLLGAGDRLWGGVKSSKINPGEGRVFVARF